MSTKSKTVKSVKKVRKVRTGTKMEKARKVFVSMRGKERQDVIQAFIKQVKLTKAGANTYYQLLKSAK